ncbi:hypothetical protein [Psychromarinibacter halotolerans]|uniref:Uncharacterized protein n=1 Tax=Psychromarinibacter halotolerans TaxID=1775175 RepID=A0ABV7GQA2_9RHOB|nr:hypothetical protein [Psychromarinibacter halotolerans]MDF0594859.1 hypothetical protein [Psychromarinibacter halotolerans]
MRINDPIDVIDQRAGRIARMSPIVAGAMVVSAAVILAFGWLGDHWQLVRPAQDAAAMVPLTAFCFVLIGLALIVFQAGGRSDKVIAQVLVLAAIALAAANYLAILTGLHDGLAFFLPGDRPYTDRMSPVTSFGMILGGLAVLATVQGRSILPLAISVFGISASICLVVLTTPDPTGDPLVSALSGLSLYTELGFLMLFTAVALDA